MKKDSSDYLDSLNQEQRKAVTAPQSPIAVIAGPGTGKTQTLLARVVYLLKELSIDPSVIMVVTFTRKAASQLRNKLAYYIPAHQYPQYIGTFHAIAFAMLQKHYGKTFSVIGTDEQEKLVPSKLDREAISAYKNGTVVADSEIQCAVTAYNRVLRSRNLVDYDDLLVLLRDELRVNSGNRPVIQHILIDEFQDTNPLQYQLIRNFNTNSCFIIGDPRQSVYSFRGARAQIFNDFTRDFSHTAVFGLKKNYRSAHRILQAAQSLFPHDVQLVPMLPHEAIIQLVLVLDEYTEADYIVRTIIERTEGIDLNSSSKHVHTFPATFSDCAVVYRTHSFAKALELSFARSGIPYQIIGGESLYENPLVRFMNQCLLYIVTQSPTDLVLPKSLQKRLPSYSDCIAILDTLKKEGAPTQPVSSVFEQLVDSFDLNRRFKKYPLWISRLQQCITTLVQFDKKEQSIESYFDYLKYLEEHDYYDPRSNVVTMITMHAAKGLEFPIVFVCGLEDGSIPSRVKGADLEEERRLLYVAMTRAQRELHLLRAQQRHGKKLPPSPFLSDIARAHLDSIEDKASIRKKARKSQLKLL